ncbi:MAG: MOP flippase family protein [Deltaproteobacteria bacterium]|nr:MOP flippase family protein [Deltaproteobacteria bacterium]
MTDTNDASPAITAGHHAAPPAGLRRKVVSAVFWVGATKLLGQIISWVITVWVARLLSPDDYGLMGMCFIVIGFVTLFNEFGLGSAIIHNKSLGKEDLSSIYWLVILINAALYAAAWLAAPLMAVWFNEPGLTALLRLIALSLIINALGLAHVNMLAKELQFKRTSIAEFAGNLAGGIATLAFALYGYGVWSLVYGNLALATVKNVAFFICLPWLPGLHMNVFRIKAMLNFGSKVAAARLLWYIYSNADFLIAGKLLGKTLLGFYSIAFQFASIPLDKIVSMLTQIAYPGFCEVQHDNVLMRRYFLKTIRLVAFVTFPLFLGIFVVADDAVRVFLTEKWAPVILPLQILCVVSTLRAINAMNAPLVVAKGRPGLSMLNNLIFALVLPIAFYIGSFYGLEGFSYSWLIVFPIIFLISASISIATIELSMIEYLKTLNHPLFATVFMVTTVMVVKYAAHDMNKLPRLALSCLAGAIAYGLYYLIVNRAMLDEARAMFRRD